MLLYVAKKQVKGLTKLFTKTEGVIHQIAEQKFQGNREKATDYVFERVAKLESNDLFPNEAREIYLNHHTKEMARYTITTKSMLKSKQKAQVLRLDLKVEYKDYQKLYKM